MAKAVRRELSRPGPGKGYLLAGVQKSPPGHLRQEQFSGSVGDTFHPREAPLEEAVGEGTETDSGKLEACERALVDKAECSTRNRRVLRSLLQRYEKTYEPRPAPHRDQRGPAEEAATPSPSSSPAGDSGPLDPGNA
ncbi:hypothetical protein T4E_9357 [Trichinella pseudospiralis]|uniref:Uncharacterized protein n=1 Tax=Trichinella pseudospiralis TaxID=6337 RepID=A0A0V0YM09_TRIPS|nr:hypothetical protein T4E_9357 [Trichinella pseudospiralis]